MGHGNSKNDGFVLAGDQELNLRSARPAGSAPRLVVLQTEEQLHFRALRVQKEVADVIQLWQEEGCPLGLTVELFTLVLGLARRRAFASGLFSIFDTDRNQKVDAFEVLSVVALLSEGQLDRKIEIIFSVFDFAGTERLSFDEVNILQASVCRGLAKICGLPAEEDQVVMDASRQCYDAHNLPYDKEVTKEQLKRWLRHDVEMSSFLDTFQHARSLVGLSEALAEFEDAQAAAFAQHCPDGDSAVPQAALLGSPGLRSSLGSPSEEAVHGLLQAMAGDGGAPTIDVARFAEGTRAWNAFCILDVGGEASLEAERFPLLRWLSQPERQGRLEQVPKGEMDARLLKSGLPKGDMITRDDWIKARLLHVGGGGTVATH